MGYTINYTTELSLTRALARFNTARPSAIYIFMYVWTKICCCHCSLLHL